MKPDLFFAMILFALIFVVSLLLVYKFAISKNGMFRKLMIMLFAAQAWTVLWSGAWFWMDAKGVAPVSFGVGRIMALFPLAAIMVWIFIWLHIQERKTKSHNEKIH